MDNSTTGRSYFILFAILLISTIPRIYGITWGLPSATHMWPYHVDEPTLFFGLKRAISERSPFIAFHGFWGGLYYYLAAGLFGTAHLLGLIVLKSGREYYLNNPDALASVYLLGRMISVAAGIGSSAILWLAGKKDKENRDVYWCSAFILALLPLPALMSHIQTGHSLAALWSTLLVVALAQNDNSRRSELMLGLIAGAAVGTEYAQGLWALPMGLLTIDRSSVKITLLRWARIAGVAIGVILITNPGIVLDYNYWREMQISQSKFISPGIDKSFILLGRLLGSFNPIILLFAAGGVFISIRNRSKLGFVVLIHLVFYSIPVLCTGNIFSRRWNPISADIAIMSAFCIVALFRKNKFAGMSCSFVGLIALLISLIATFTSFTDKDTRDPSREWIIENISAGTSIGIENWFFVPHIPIDRYEITRDEFEKRPPIWITSQENAPVPRQLKEAGYNQIALFHRPVTFSGYELNEYWYPSEIRYVNPDISVWEKK